MASSTVLIEELVSVGKGRKILLVGPALPLQGAVWGGKLSMSTVWYPGNGVEATQQVLGPQLMPSSWEGIFRRTQMGRVPSVYTDENGSTTKVTSPVFMRDALQLMFELGVRLRVTWTQIRETDGRKFEIVREGRAEQWEFPHDRIEDISWRITFVWVSKGVDQQKAVSVRDADVSASFAQLDAYMNELQAKVQTDKIRQSKQGVKNSVGKLTLGQLEALAKAPDNALKSLTRSLQQNINGIKRAVDVADSFRSIPSQLTGSVLSFTQNNIAIINQYVDAWSRRPAEEQSNKARAADITRSLTYFGQSAETMRSIARQSQQTATNIGKQSSVSNSRGGAVPKSVSSNNRPGSILAVHICKQGETAQVIAAKYYGTADKVADLLKANRLPINTVSLQPGKILVVPALGVGTGSDV